VKWLRIRPNETELSGPLAEPSFLFGFLLSNFTSVIF